MPGAVQRFIELIEAADYVVICSPEYAHGVPGALKNALDWTVVSNVWNEKPVAIITAALQGDHAHASLMEILSTMSASVRREACLLIPFIKTTLNAQGVVTDAATSEALRAALSCRSITN